MAQFLFSHLFQALITFVKLDFNFLKNASYILRHNQQTFTNTMSCQNTMGNRNQNMMANGGQNMTNGGQKLCQIIPRNGETYNHNKQLRFVEIGSLPGIFDHII